MRTSTWDRQRMWGLALVASAGMFGCGDSGTGATAGESSGTGAGPASATDSTVTATTGTASTPTTTGDTPTTGSSQGQTQSTGQATEPTGATTESTMTATDSTATATEGTATTSTTGQTSDVSTGTTGAVSVSSTGGTDDTTGGEPKLDLGPQPCAPDSQATTFDFIWIANTSQGTVSKINTMTGIEVGRYFTGPNGGAAEPSRTSVNQYGDVAVSNRTIGSTAKIAATSLMRS